MWKISYFLFVFGVAANLKYAYAVTKEERQEFLKVMKPTAEECAEELGLEDFDIEDVRETRDPCFFECVLKKTATFENGMIVLDTVHNILQDVIKDGDEIAQIIEKGQECAEEANGSDVSADDQDCTRVAIFHRCLGNKGALIVASS